MPKYETLSLSLTREMEQARSTGALPQVGTPNAAASRRTQRAGDQASIWRPAFVHDIDKILHCPYYNRCTDKTQVFYGD